MRRGGWRRRARNGSPVLIEGRGAPRCARLSARSALASPAQAQSLPDLAAGSARRSAMSIWWAVTAGTALAALLAPSASSARAPRRSGSPRRSARSSRFAPRSTAPRRCSTPTTSAPSSGTAVGEPQIFGGLPERGRRARRQGCLPRLRELAERRKRRANSKPPPTSSAARARLSSIAVRAADGALLEASRAHQRPPRRSCACAS